MQSPGVAFRIRKRIYIPSATSPLVDTGDVDALAGKCSLKPLESPLTVNQFRRVCSNGVATKGATGMDSQVNLKSGRELTWMPVHLGPEGLEGGALVAELPGPVLKAPLRALCGSFHPR